MQKSINVPQLNKFINSWHSIASILSENIYQNNKKYDLDCCYLARFFNEFSQEYQQYYEAGHTINVWSIASVGADEVRNCKILAWLFEPKGSHGLGHYFFYYFINYLKTTKKSLANDLPDMGKIENKKYKVTTEVPYLSGDEEQTNNRLDIQVEWLDFFIILEVKINAGQTGNQIDRYIELGNNKNQGTKNWALLYLTRNGEEPTYGKNDNSKNKKPIICLSWREISIIIEGYMKDCYIKNHAENKFTNLLLRQYCKHIKTFN